MSQWNADDRHERWIYRTIYPAEVRNAEHRLIQFKTMDEELGAEADWNFDDTTVSRQLTMSQRRGLTEVCPMGLSFFSFENDHLNTVVCADLPTSAENGDVLAVLVENNPSIKSSNAYHQIVTKRSQPRKIRNAVGEEVTLKAFICYKANSERTRSPFCCIRDNNPQNHRTVAPDEGETMNCIDCTVGGRLAAEPTTEPTLFQMLDCRMHCFRIRAAAKPRHLLPHFDGDVHRLACVLYRGFDTDGSEEDSTTIIDVLQFLEQNDYQLSALTLLKKQCIMKLLYSLFSNEHLDEEETKEVEACLQWMRNEVESPALFLVSREQQSNRPTQCDGWMQSIISDASSVVSRLESTTTC